MCSYESLYVQIYVKGCVDLFILNKHSLCWRYGDDNIPSTTPFIPPVSHKPINRVYGFSVGGSLEYEWLFVCWWWCGGYKWVRQEGKLYNRWFFLNVLICNTLLYKFYVNDFVFQLSSTEFKPYSFPFFPL